MTEISDSQIELLCAARDASLQAADKITTVLTELTAEQGQWVYPVGSLEFPTEQWYCATVHDMTGAKNNGYAHTGIDLNVDHHPWGDVDRGQSVYAVADGVVHAAHYSTNYLGSVVVKMQHDGAPLWVRYWHLANDDTFRYWNADETVKADAIIGHLGNYRLGAGGDHCHFDMALDPFGAHWWFTKHDIRWIDPVPVLKAHLDPEVVDAMMARGG